MTPDITQQRQDGWYWVRWYEYSGWTPHLWKRWYGREVRHWELRGTEQPFEIGPRIPMPDEKASAPVEPEHGPFVETMRKLGKPAPAEVAPQTLEEWGWFQDGDLWICNRCEMALEKPAEHICKPSAAPETPAPAPVTPEELRVAAAHCHRANPELAQKLYALVDWMEKR